MNGSYHIGQTFGNVKVIHWMPFFSFAEMGTFPGKCNVKIKN